jgi:hypothetical protein
MNRFLHPDLVPRLFKNSSTDGFPRFRICIWLLQFTICNISVDFRQCVPCNYTKQFFVPARYLEGFIASVIFCVDRSLRVQPTLCLLPQCHSQSSPLPPVALLEKIDPKSRKPYVPSLLFCRARIYTVYITEGEKFSRLELKSRRVTIRGFLF